ncbi:MAG: hypothetical protein ABFD54_15460 [Armatimonadota bacterium]
MSDELQTEVKTEMKIKILPASMDYIDHEKQSARLPKATANKQLRTVLRLFTERLRGEARNGSSISRGIVVAICLSV